MLNSERSLVKWTVIIVDEKWNWRRWRTPYRSKHASRIIIFICYIVSFWMIVLYRFHIIVLSLHIYKQGITLIEIVSRLSTSPFLTVFLLYAPSINPVICKYLDRFKSVDLNRDRFRKWGTGAYEALKMQKLWPPLQISIFIDSDYLPCDMDLIWYLDRFKSGFIRKMRDRIGLYTIQDAKVVTV